MIITYMFEVSGSGTSRFFYTRTRAMDYCRNNDKLNLYHREIFSDNSLPYQDTITGFSLEELTGNGRIQITIKPFHYPF